MSFRRKNFRRGIILFLTFGAFLGAVWYLSQTPKSTTDLSTKAALKDFQPPKPPAEIIESIRQMKNATPSATGPFRIPILMYHYVEYPQDKNDTIRISLTTLPATLEKQIKTLQNDGYTFLTTRDLGDILDGKTPLPAKPILLTFDDGYRDFYTDAYPILKKYHVKATEYVVAGFINWPNYMFDNQVKEIARDGLVEIGAHTVHHVALRGTKMATSNFEVLQSRDILNKLTGRDIVSFAFPYGSFDSQAINVVKNAGFKTAVATLPGILQGQENRYFLFRLRPGVRTEKHLLDWLNQKKFTPY